MGGLAPKRKGGRVGVRSSVASASASSSTAITPPSQPRPAGRPWTKNTQLDKNNNRKSPPAIASPPSFLSPACAVSVTSSLTTSSTPKRKVVATDTVTANDHDSSPSKFLCLEQEELKIDLASALEVSAENLVETLTSLLIFFRCATIFSALTTYAIWGEIILK